MKITILGSGTIRSGADRSCTAIWINNRRYNILIDCGPGTFYRIKQLKIKPDSISHIFLTHFHPDHCSDLIPLLFYYSNAAPPAPRSISLWGPAGLDSFLRALKEAYGEWLFLPFLKVNEITGPVPPFSDLTVKWEKVSHTAESVGYRFEFPSAVIAFSGDSGPCPALQALCYQADLAILECALPDTSGTDTHLTPATAGRIARDARVKKLVLTHLYPETRESDPVHRAKKYFPGPVHLAEDLDQFEL